MMLSFFHALKMSPLMHLLKTEKTTPTTKLVKAVLQLGKNEVSSHLSSGRETQKATSQ